MTQPSVVQTSARVSKAPPGSSVDHAVSAFGSNVVSGNSVLVFVSGRNFNGAVPTDTLGTTYALDTSFTETSFSAWSVWVFRGVLASSGADSVTVSVAGLPDQIDVICQEVASLAASPLDKTVTSTGGNWGTAPDIIPTTGALTQAEEIVYSLAMGRCQQTPAVGFATLPVPTGFAGVFTGIGSPNLGNGTATISPNHFAYQIVNSVTGSTVTWSPTEAQVNTAPSAALLTVTYKGVASSGNIAWIKA